MLFSFKHNVAAVFMLGSLLSISQAQATMPNVSQYIPHARSLAAAGTVGYLYTHQADENTTNPLRKGVDFVSKKFRASCEFVDKNKIVIGLMAAAAIAGYDGFSSFNTPKGILKAVHFKSAIGWASFIKEPAVKQAAAVFSPEQMAQLRQLVTVASTEAVNAALALGKPVVTAAT